MRHTSFSKYVADRVGTSKWAVAFELEPDMVKRGYKVAIIPHDYEAMKCDFHHRSPDDEDYVDY